MTRLDNIEEFLRRRTDPSPPERKRRLGLLARYWRLRIFIVNREHKECLWGRQHKGQEL